MKKAGLACTRELHRSLSIIRGDRPPISDGNDRTRVAYELAVPAKNFRAPLIINNNSRTTLNG